MKKATGFILLILLFAWQFYTAYAVQRFPKPEFDSGYVTPQTLLPNPRASVLAIMDVVVLLTSLSVISWMVIKKRWRNGVYWMSIFSLAYFGFYREGCVCAVGSLQNITLAMFDHSYVVPLSVIAFFILPLAFTLMFGRTFCAGVCPFGAVQDFVALKPQKLGTRTKTVLGILPYIYLGLAVLYAATGTDFIICRYDPFVGFFRFNASFGMFFFGTTLLLSGIFIARPYCRFLCPYGVLLNWISRFSKYHITITPSNCVQCKLCEHSCPYDAIDKPLLTSSPEEPKTRLRKFVFLCILIPLLAFAGGFIGSRLHETLAHVNYKIRLSEKVMAASDKLTSEESIELDAFKSSGQTNEQLYAEAREILNKFYWGGWLVGGFVGLVFGFMLAGLLLKKYNADYVPNKANCLSCTRCVDYCPVK